MIARQIHKPYQRHARRGAITVLAAFFSIVMLGVLAFSVDVGYVLSSREELQRTADAAALAAAWDYCQAMADGQDPVTSQGFGREAASVLAANNVVARSGPELLVNASNEPSGDVVFGYIDDFNIANPQLVTGQSDLYNAVRVRVRRDSLANDNIPLFFANIFGHGSHALHSEATAAIVHNVSGFRARANGANLDLLPFALDRETHDRLLAGLTADNWTWDAQSGRAKPGPDGILEVNLYPQDTGAPGNRGTVDIGSNGNSTNDITRQILYGVSSEDLAYHGGELRFNADGELFLNGDTGISAGVKDELTEIIGQPRTIPIFSEVNGPGNNAEYTIVRWQGIRIMDVKLTGPLRRRHVIIQPAPVVTSGVIPSSTVGTSSFVYSPAVLLQ